MRALTNEMTGAQTPLDRALGLTHTLREAARHGERAVLLCSFQKEESVLIDELMQLDQGTGSAVRIVTMRTAEPVPWSRRRSSSISTDSSFWKEHSSTAWPP